MKASDFILVPLKADFLALQGLAILHRTFEKIKTSLNPNLVFLGILITMFSSSLNICKDVENNVRSIFKKRVFYNKIPQNVTIAESPSYSVPVTLHGPKSAGAKSYQQFTMEFLCRVLGKSPKIPPELQEEYKMRPEYLVTFDDDPYGEKGNT
jgi:chromosome partitioning protein